MGHVQLLDENDEVIPNSDSHELVENRVQGVFLGIDPMNNRRWKNCPHQETLRPLETCTLKSVTLVGEAKSGPEVKLSRGIPRWQGPRFYLFPDASTLIFGGSREKLFSTNVTLWVADLSTGSVRERGFPGHLHDDGLTGRSAISPDGKVVVFAIGRSMLAPPFLVDSYIDKGERLLLVDVQTLRTIANVEPAHKGGPLAMAVDHRDGRTTLLTNWGDCWERKQFPDK